MMLTKKETNKEHQMVHPLLWFRSFPWTIIYLIRRERISLDRDHGRERCSDFHSVASTTTTSKSVRFSMEQQLEEEAEAAAAEIYMDYRYE